MSFRCRDALVAEFADKLCWYMFHGEEEDGGGVRKRDEDVVVVAISLLLLLLFGI
jgi:hypothetical protein